MIFNAKDKSIIPSTLPNVSEAILNWFRPLTILKLTKTIVDFKIIEESVTIKFQGLLISNTQKLDIKAGGQRNWLNHTLYTDTGVELETDDLIVFKGLNYRVDQKSNFSDFGYLQYSLIQDYKEPIG